MFSIIRKSAFLLSLLVCFRFGAAIDYIPHMPVSETIVVPIYLLCVIKTTLISMRVYMLRQRQKQIVLSTLSCTMYSCGHVSAYVFAKIHSESSINFICSFCNSIRRFFYFLQLRVFVTTVFVIDSCVSLG